jgi:hypothetical protein
MRTNYFKSIVKAAAKTAATLLFAAVATYGQQTINLAAGPTTVTLPDGNVVPMWGYTCGAAVAPTSGPAATCAALNTAAAGWSPVVITVPVNTSGATSLTVNLTNNLSFANGNTVPTSIMIVGQLGGGLGSTPTRSPSPTHADLGVSWATVNTPGSPNPTFAPPTQGARVQSFGTEVAAGATTALTWSNLRPGTYLLESGTHPSIQVPMGLHGILVVTTVPSGTTLGTAYPNVSYDAEVPFEFSEIDAVQNSLVSTAVNTAGFSETMVWSGQPGGCGNPTSSSYNQCYPPAVNYTPKYYLINGRGFDKTNASASVFPTTPSTVTSGSVLVRLVNAGSKMHVPSIVGSQTTPLFATITPPTVTGFSIIAEDGNVPPGVSKVQSDVFMAAGKTFDVMINVPTSTTALPIYDRELSLSGNSVNRDSGMLAYISVNGAAQPSAASLGAATANPDTYDSVIAGQTLTVSDPSKGVLANDTNVFGAQVISGPTQGTLIFNTNGTFTYTANSSWSAPDTFTYCGNGTTSGAACAMVTLGPGVKTAGITCTPLTFPASIATYVAIKTPGVLAGCTDKSGYPLTVATSTITPGSGLTVFGDANGGFTASLATAPSAAASYSFQFQAKNSQGTLGPVTTATITFPAPSGLAVTVLDGADKTTQITDYRWIIEEDRTFYINPGCVSNPPPAGCPTAALGIVPTLGVNFHTSYMPYIAQGCTGPLSCESGQTVYNPGTGTHVATVCDLGNGMCDVSSGRTQETVVLPSSVSLDPSKRYYISILPGDAAQPFLSGYTGSPSGCNNTSATAAGSASATPSTTCGHGMGGAPIAAGQTAVTILTQPSPYPPAKLSVFVFEDDFPLNGEQDGGGGIDVLSPNEPGLGGFQIHLWDAMGGNGDFTGQMTYDMFNQPLTNSLDGMIDPSTGQNACPITKLGQGITGMIVTCPKYESDGVTLSPLAGQAVIANLMPGRFGVVATPAADRIARGEEWLQTNTLDGQKAHDSFVRIGEPSYFQEFGPASFHVSIGFANPAIINARLAGVCGGTDPNITGNCTPGNTLTGTVSGEHLSRTPDERLFDTGSHDAFYWTQCYASFGDPDGEDFAFVKCDANGNFSFKGLPDGDWRITTFDQWNDQLVDGLSTPVRLGSTPFCPGSGSSQHVCNMGDISATQWQTNLYTRTFIDDNKDGISQATEGGIPFANVAVRLRDGSLENLLVTDFNGTANFNETFPLFSWYVVETDVTRYKNTGTHVVYDVGGPVDGTLSTCGGPTTSSGTGYPPCGTSSIGHFLANTAEQVSLPDGVHGSNINLRFPGSVYCAVADCTGKSIQNGPGTSDPPSVCTSGNGATSCSTQLSSGRIDPPWVGVEGWQGYPGQNNFIEFGKEPYVAGENGGIKGHVIYASTRPFDDPQMLVQTQWEPLVPHVTINLYQEGFAADGVTSTLTLVDHTQTTSWDDWAQGFHSDGHGNMIPNMNCPGQGATSGAIPDLFYFSLYNQPNYLDFYNSQHGGAASTTLPYNSQFKCYDGMHNWNQIQPAPYDGMYQFPSVTSTDPATGKPNGTNCAICQANNLTATTLPANDLYYGLPQLPPGKYVVEIVLPQGYELVKEEDKNILIGDNFIAPVTQEFGGLGNVFIIPDQASVASSQQYPGAGYNANNAQNPTQSLGASPNNQIVPGFIPEPVWPCVGEARIVPDYISLYPQTHQVAPFAGATRNLCDRKEVTLEDQMGAIAKFYIYTSTHIASKFTGGITDDYTSEFDPFSPQFGEKFAPPDLPVSVKDWAGNEISRVYADQWGAYDGMTYSTWEVNPPNPTGYSPTMMVLCMNDPGPIPGSNGTLVTDPLFTQGYSQFCYELPFMPGTTQYLDTPVVPTSAFAGAGYNNVDCYYPDATPAIAEVDGDSVGPWVSAPNKTLTITAVGDVYVPNYAYSGPQATVAPYNQKTLKRHYGFGTQCTAIGTTCSAISTVTIGGVTAPITGWGDGTITVTVPSTVPPCAIQQQAQYSSGAGNALCGQLVITAGNGKQSVDTVTVTVGGKAPTHINASSTIQSAIDAASPGDLLIVDPTCTTGTGAVLASVSCTTNGVKTAGASTTAGAHNEMLLMWKPVRLQGVGAFSSIINANTQPAGKMDPWRRQVACLFGLALNGTPITGTNPYDSATDTANNGGPYVCTSAMNFSVDRLPLEATVGWDATLNGNLAELLQEPTLMGALEGAAITVLSKGVKFPSGSNPFGADTFPTGTTLLSSADCTTGSGHTNPYPSNFWCNPSRIDGLGITDSSQGGGGIFVHAWGHNLEISNNRVYNNAGTLSGGINVGQGEFPPAYLSGAANATTNAAPGSCYSDTNSNHLGFPLGLDFGNNVNTVLPYCHDVNVNVHNNYVALNSSTGDELFSATPAGAGGVSFCTGADNYKFNYNWVCGNLSSGDGGGFAHMGVSYNADIEHNTFIFNQSLNPTIPANGGGVVIMGSPDADPPCGATTDQDCLASPSSIGPSDGVGQNLVINANLIMGNAAESGSGGGLRLQNVNGSDIISFPNLPQNWWHITITNNIIADNVAGWDGGGISLLDALNTDIINNTIVSNDTTATAGVLFNTIGAPLASSSGPTCTSACGTTSAPQPAGLVSIQDSAVLSANIGILPAGTHVICPANHFAPGTTANNGTCIKISYPLLANNVFWQNGAYYIGVGPLVSAQFQQNVVSLYNAFTSTLAPNQPAADATVINAPGSTTITGGTGACVATSYWDIGVRGDTGPGNHASTFQLDPTYSVLTNTGTTAEGGLGTHNTLGSNPYFISQYCDGSRTPPEFQNLPGGSGWDVPPGISDATVPNPIFNLTPVATVDEGNNWINLRWGPLSMVNTSGGANNGTILGNYGPTSTSPTINYIPSTAGIYYADAPSLDFYGTARKTNNAVDAGAVEYIAAAAALPTLTSITPNSGVLGQQVSVTLIGTNLTGATSVNVSGTGVTVGPLVINAGGTQITTTFTIGRLVATGSRNVTVTTPAGTSTGTVTFTVESATLRFSAISPALTTTPANRTTKIGTVTVTNTATGPTAGPFILSAAPTIAKLPVIGGPGTFSIITTGPNAGTCVSGASVAPGSSCTIGVQYVPPAAPATLSTATADITLQVVGTAIATQVDLSFISAN